MPMFGSSLAMPSPSSPAQPAGMFGDRFENPWRALAVTLGPAIMGQALNMPQLAGMGPQILGMAAQSKQAAQDRALRERALKLEESKASRERAMAESVSRMFAGGTAAPGAVPPEAAIEAATAAGAGPGPTRVAAGMMGAPETTTGAPGGMFASLSPSERATAATLAASDPNAALKYASERSFAREKMTGPTRLQRNLEAGGLVPGTPEYERAALLSIMPPSTTVNLKQPALETEEAKAVGKFYGEQYTNLQQAGTAARTQNAKLDRMGQLLEGVYTGTGGETVLAAKRLGSMLGMDFEGMGEAEAAQAIGNEFALSLRNPAGGAGMPGAMSDRDREFLQSMTPSLSTTPEGRRLMIETRKRLNNRDIEVAREARNYRKTHGRLDEGFYDQLDDKFADSDLFSDLTPEGGEEAPRPIMPRPEMEAGMGLPMPGAPRTIDPATADIGAIQDFLATPGAAEADPTLLDAISKRLEALGK